MSTELSQESTVNISKPLTTAHKTTLKRYDGVKWIPVYLTSSSDITMLGEEIEVVGDHGAFKDGDIVPGTMSVKNVLKKLLRNLIPPTYNHPSVNLFLSPNKLENAGTSGVIYIQSGNIPDGYIVSELNKADEGALVRHQIFRMGSNQVPVMIEAEPGDGVYYPADNRYYTPTIADIIADEPVTYYSEYQYEQGPIKQNNFEEDDPNGRIEAGTVQSEPLKFIPIFDIYYGYDSDGVSDPITEPEEIVKLKNGVDNPDTDYGQFFAAIDPENQPDIKFTMNLPGGITRITIAYPTWLPLNRLIILYDGGGNSNIVKLFGTNIVSMDNLRVPTDYCVRTLSWDQPTADEMIFSVSFKEPLQ